MITFNSGPLSNTDMRRLLQSSGVHASAEPDSMGIVSLELAADAPELARLRELLAFQGLSWFEQIEERFSHDELRRFPLLRVVVRRAELGYGGPRHGTQYDLTASCPFCGSGARQASPLRVTKVPKSGDIFQTLDRELMVSERIKSEFVRADIRGVELRQIQSARDLSPLPWFQVLPQYEMPLMDETTDGLVRDHFCPRCRRDGYFEENLRIRYNEQLARAEELPDVVRTRELFGNSVIRSPFEQSSFAAPIILVKSRVLDVLEATQVRGVEFDPVCFV